MFVLVDVISLRMDLQKSTLYKFFFRVSTYFSDIFTHYIQNLEIYNAFIIFRAKIHGVSTEKVALIEYILSRAAGIRK